MLRTTGLRVMVCLLMISSPALAQSDDMKGAAQAYRDAGRHYQSGEHASAIDKALEAQALLRRDLERYRYAEALSLRALGRLGEAWRLLDALAAQTDEPETAQRARETLDDMLATLEADGHATIGFECGASAAEVRVARAPSNATPPAARPADSMSLLGRWLPCKSWRDQQLLVPGRYTVHLRQKNAIGAEIGSTTLAVDLAPGDRKEVLVHYALAPNPPIYIEGGGCGSAGFQQVAPLR